MPIISNFPTGDAQDKTYGSCATAAATAAKVVTLDGFKLETGASISVKFNNANTAANPTLNVNNTGAKSIMKYGTTAVDTNMWQAGAVVGFSYDGTNWVMENGTTATTDYYGVTKLSSATNSTATNLAATPSAVKAAKDAADAAQTTANGKWTAVDSTTAQKGIVKLNSATNSTSETEAATPKAVKTAYDLANTANTAAGAALPKAGGTMTGALTLSGAPTANLHAATKKYVDDLVSAAGGNPPIPGISKVLNDNTWAQISQVSDALLGPNYWAVGDRKAVTINGTVGTLAVNATYYVYILGFNHNSALEGTGIHFGGFKSALTGGADICLVDSAYNTTSNDGTKKFNLNHWGGSSSPYNTNYGGWAGCDARYDILGSTDTAPSGYGSTPTTSRVGYDASVTTATSPVANTLMAALPSDLRAVMKPMTKYTDNKGNSSNTAAGVSKTVDYLPLLAEFEIFGTRSYANQYEKDYQRQYAYYSAGNSKVKYRHDATTSTAYWWERSPYCDTAYYFCSVYTNGNANSNGSRNSYGLAPAFKV